MLTPSKFVLLIVSLCLPLLLAGCGDTLGHISANVPDEAVFDSLLTRDLNSYFGTTLKTPVSVTHQMLRNGPTQSGVAYPKYYVWVKIFSDKNLKDEGAVRVAAEDKTHFEVTDFCSKSEIQKHPTMIETVFPQALCKNILAHANGN